jgi:hypothetical protein
MKLSGNRRAHRRSSATTSRTLQRTRNCCASTWADLCSLFRPIHRSSRFIHTLVYF